MTNTTANPRQKLLFAAVMSAVVLAIMMVTMVSVGTREAQAFSSSITSVKGTVFEVRGTNYTKSAGATVRLWKWNGLWFEYTGMKTTTNSYGQYRFPEVPTNYHYQVQATKVYGSCPKLYVFDGYSTIFSPPTSSTGVNATVNMNYYIDYCR